MLGDYFPFLVQEDVDDEIALARSLAAGGSKVLKIGGGLHHT